MIPADTLNPHKAGILLMLALSSSDGRRLLYQSAAVADGVSGVLRRMM